MRLLAHQHQTASFLNTTSENKLHFGIALRTKGKNENAAKKHNRQNGSTASFEHPELKQMFLCFWFGSRFGSRSTHWKTRTFRSVEHAVSVTHFPATTSTWPNRKLVDCAKLPTFNVGIWACGKSSGLPTPARKYIQAKLVASWFLQGKILATLDWQKTWRFRYIFKNRMLNQPAPFSQSENTRHICRRTSWFPAKPMSFFKRRRNGSSLRSALIIDLNSRPRCCTRGPKSQRLDFRHK